MRRSYAERNPAGEFGPVPYIHDNCSAVRRWSDAIAT